MLTIPVRTRLEAGGVLNLCLPTGLPEVDVEVVVVLHPVEAQAKTWPEDFFCETYGAFADHPLQRGSQGAFDDREVLR